MTPINPSRPIVYVWTDGSTKPTNPGPGGWAFLLQTKVGDEIKELERNGSNPYTSNVRMELVACLRALQVLKKPCKVVIHTDSQYIIDGFRNLSRDKLLKTHYDVWGLILHLSQLHNILTVKVKGHSDDLNNDRADALAKQAATEQRGDPYMWASERAIAELLYASRHVERRSWEY